MVRSGLGHFGARCRTKVCPAVTGVSDIVLSPRSDLREDQNVLDFIRSCRLPVHSYRQRGVGGPLRMLHDPSEKITHDFFDRDELDAPRRGVDVLSGLMKRAEEAEVSMIEH